jgi:hypothetical protein
MPTSRYLRTPLRTVTITGTTEVGGDDQTVIELHADHTIRFIDANEVEQVIPVAVQYHDGDFELAPGLTPRNDAAAALYALMDVLDRRA